jgi:hypothetical protein
MIALICFVLAVLASPCKSNIRLEAENAVLRHQLIVLRRKLKGRARLTNNDRWFFVQLYRWFPSILPALMIIRPETLVGCLSPGSAIRRHKFARHTGRTSSSIRSDLDFRYTQAAKAGSVPTHERLGPDDWENL